MKDRYNIFYFSGTGNSRKAAEVIHEKLLKEGLSSTLGDVSKETQDKADFFIFVFPVYALVAAAPMTRFIRKLPANQQGKKAILLATIGRIDLQDSVPGCEGISLQSLGNILRKKGFEVVMSDAVSYPENLGIITRGPEEKQLHKMINESIANTEQFAEKIINRKYESRRKPFFLLKTGSYLFGALFMIFGRRFIGKLFTTSRQCNACAVCANKCPVKAIRMAASTPYWTWKCEGCLRCFNNCPHNAIRFSMIKGIAAIAVLFVPYHKVLTSFVHLENQILQSTMAVSVWIILCLAATIAALELIDLLSRIPLLGTLFHVYIPLPYKQYKDPGKFIK